jgi:hypothetical protein
MQSRRMSNKVSNMSNVGDKIMFHPRSRGAARSEDMSHKKDQGFEKRSALNDISDVSALNDISDVAHGRV